MPQNPGNDLWNEEAAGGGTPSAVGLVIRESGSNRIWDSTGPEEAKFIGYRGDGNYYLLDLALKYIVESGGNLVLSDTGQADAIIIDGGSGNLSLSTNLLAAAAADLLTDPLGTVVTVLRAFDRLDAVAVRTNAYTY